MTFHLKAQLAAPGDQTKDGSKPWPDDRKVVDLGVLTIDKAVPDSLDAQKKLLFLPTSLTDGIEESDDPVIDTRSAGLRRLVQPALRRSKTHIGRPIRLQLVIFDLDGTLVDSQDFIVEAQRRAFAAHGIAAPSPAASLVDRRAFPARGLHRSRRRRCAARQPRGSLSRGVDRNCAAPGLRRAAVSRRAGNHRGPRRLRQT